VHIERESIASFMEKLLRCSDLLAALVYPPNFSARRPK